MSLPIVVCLAMLGCAAPSLGTAAEPAEALHRRAVEDARAGRTAEALQALRALLEQQPARQEFVGDLAVILGWAGDHAAAVALLDRLDRRAAPPYVLEGLAGSARRVKQPALAESLYRESIARAPDRVDPVIGLAMILADAGAFDEAAAMLAGLRSRFPRNAEIIEAQAELALARRDPYEALASYQTILAQDPANAAALRGRIQILSRIGAAHLALELADRHPDLLAPAERDAIAADRTAYRIRWGGLDADQGRGTARFAALDRALEESEAAGRRALDPAADLNAVDRQLALDRVTALRDRFRMRDAIALHAALAAHPAPVPAYVKSAAASAYLYLQQPETARDLYREALAADPVNLEMRLGLFYALAEAEEHAAALELIERIVADTPQWIDAWSPATIRENPAYARVLSARGMAPLLANRPGEAWRRLSALTARAPFNAGVRTDYASSMRARGWPRTAEEELRWILAVEPDNSGTLGERAGALLEMRDYRAAEIAVAAAQSIAAENGRVVRAARLYEVHNLRELIIEGTSGRSSGGPTGTRGHVLEAWLYSSPMAYRYRAFAHLYDAQARFANGTGRRERAGVGLEYRSPLVIATGEISNGLDGSRTGAAATVAVTPGDFWTLRGRLDSSANEIPLQAHLAGINARRAGAEIAWRANEARAATVSLDHFDFSDGNRRVVTQARWTERVVAGPVYKLEVTAGLFASKNSLVGTPYFNPVSDFSPTLELANEWLHWRRYTRAFRHRLVITVGSYRQEGFSTGPLSGVRYEQEWQADDRLTFRYGAGRNQHPYDGVRTARDFAYFHLNWRF